LEPSKEDLEFLQLHLTAELSEGFLENHLVLGAKDNLQGYYQLFPTGRWSQKYSILSVWKLICKEKFESKIFLV
jgi:hypothetical protein